MRPRPFALALSLALAGCKPSHPPAPPLPAVGAPYPAGSVLGPVAFELALYPTAEGYEEPQVTLTRLAAQHPRLHLARPNDGEAAPRPAFWAATVTSDQYGPPLRALHKSAVAHLSPEERKALAGVARVTFISFRGDVADASGLLREAQQLVYDAAAAQGALILDSETGEFFSPTSFQAARLEGWSSGLPDLNRQVVVRGRGPRRVTAGMGKLGLPDLLVEGPEVVAHAGEAHALLDLTAQRLAAQPELAVAGRLDLEPVPPALAVLLRGSSTLTVRAGQHAEGDAENRLLELVLPQSDAGGP